MGRNGEGENWRGWLEKEIEGSRGGRKRPRGREV
jgi:hypothetical protein